MKRLLMGVARVAFAGVLFVAVRSGAVEQPAPHEFCICPGKEPVCSGGQSVECHCPPGDFICGDCKWRCATH